MVANIFSQAQSVAPCLIWIDQVEELLAFNTASHIGAEEGISVQFLKHMTAVRDSGQKVWIVAATNKPWNLSPPMLRRFTSRIYVSLPDKHDVLMLLKKRLKFVRQTKTCSGHQPYTLDKEVLGEEMDKLTNKYFKYPRQRYLSGDDIVRGVQTIPQALLEELKKSGARIFKKVGLGTIYQVSTFADKLYRKLYLACNTSYLATT